MEKRREKEMKRMIVYFSLLFTAMSLPELAVQAHVSDHVSFQHEESVDKKLVMLKTLLEMFIV